MTTARILAVDDQSYFRSFLEGVLTEAGYSVRTVASGAKALQALERQFFDVVVTDLVMPEMDGVDLVSQIKDRFPDQEIIVVTGVGDVKTAVEAMKRGAREYLLKPIDRTVLLQSLEGILKTRRLRDEHSRLMEENLEFMGLLSIYERAVSLFATQALEPLAEKMVEALCLETRAQGGVLWVVQNEDRTRLHLVGARGLVQLDQELEVLSVSKLVERFPECAAPAGVGFFAAADLGEASPTEASTAHALYAPFFDAGQLVGLARFTDKIDGETFSDRDRLVCDKFVELSSSALRNALRFRDLERQRFQDPTTGAYSTAYFNDIVQNEIRKATRFGRGFSILDLAFESVEKLRTGLTAEEVDQWIDVAMADVRKMLRVTDLVGARSSGCFRLLLPETDALGVAVVKRRLRKLLTQHIDGTEIGLGGEAQPALAAVTYPTDGTQLEMLNELLDSRRAEDRESLVRVLGLEGRIFREAVSALMQTDVRAPATLISQVAEFFLEEVGRRPGDRGLLFIWPGQGGLDALRDRLLRLGPLSPRTEIVIVREDQSETLPGAPITSVALHRVGARDPFVIYFGAGPAYALIQKASGTQDETGEGVCTFQVHDRALVEFLAFQLQSDLGIALTNT